MVLPLGEAGISEIQNESSVLGAVQSDIGDNTGLYVFSSLGVAKNASRQEKSEAMKHMSEKVAAKPSGILMCHAPGRPFALGKSLGIEFSAELLKSILVVFPFWPRRASAALLAELASCLSLESWPR